MTLPRTIGSWSIVDSGVLPSEKQMAIDADTLRFHSESDLNPTLRFFQWPEKIISFGYLLDPSKVSAWAQEKGPAPTVKRPTGGGAVLHDKTDLNISLLWARSLPTFSDRPRACYAEIHKILQAGLSAYLEQPLSLFSKLTGSCAEPSTAESGRFSVCFEEPVCNDVMAGEKKIIGGALRITKHAVLYQGTVALGRSVDMDSLKYFLIRAFEPVFSGVLEEAMKL